MSRNEPSLIVIAGPTASGKTALALRVAKEFSGEIVSCDSVAVYRLMDIGSAKPSLAEQALVPHHCIDIYWPDEFCTAGDYARHARRAIAEISSRGNVPIVVGGTGLYLRALLDGLAPAPPRNEMLRERLRRSEKRHGAGHLHRLLARLDASAARSIHANDLPKVIRSIEMTLAARRPQTEQWQAGRDPLRGFRLLKFALAPERAELYSRISERAATMFSRGLIEETEMLRARFGTQCRALGALGYAQAMAFLDGNATREEAISSAQQGHRNYAKRQLTWFRREPAMQWLNGFGDEVRIQAEVIGMCAAHMQDAVGGEGN